MKHVMKAALLSTTIVFSSLLLSGCGASLTPIDPFEKLEVTFSGISGYTGTYELNDPVYDGSQYITYYCPQRDAVLSNGDTITIGFNCADTDAIKKAGYKVEPGLTKEYVVKGLLEVPDELADAEIEQLSAALMPTVGVAGDPVDYQVGDVIDKLEINYCSYDLNDEAISQQMNHGVWKVEQVTPWEKEGCYYNVWSDPKKSVNNQEIINSLGIICKKTIQMKCTDLDEWGKQFAEYNAEHPDEPMDVSLPSIDDTISITLYYSDRFDYSGIYRNENGLVFPSQSDNKRISDRKEDLIENLNVQIPSEVTVITAKEY